MHAYKNDTQVYYFSIFNICKLFWQHWFCQPKKHFKYHYAFLFSCVCPSKNPWATLIFIPMEVPIKQDVTTFVWFHSALSQISLTCSGVSCSEHKHCWAIVSPLSCLFFSSDLMGEIYKNACNSLKTVYCWSFN